MRKFTDWVLERLAWCAGIAAILMIVAMLFYLASETRYAFNRDFPFGYRFALSDPGDKAVEEVGMDPFSSFLGAHPDGSDGVDEKEEGIAMPSLEELKGSASFGTGVALGGDPAKATPDNLYRDDWRQMKHAERGDRFVLYAFATPEYQGRTMRLRWEPDAGFEPKLAPYGFLLKLLRAPKGVEVASLQKDLSRDPRGFVDLPAFVAHTDAERTQGYAFTFEAIPGGAGQIGATMAQLNQSEWAPTNRYSRFGLWPLLLGTLTITLLALVIATPPSILTALYLSEIAPSRLREWLKPVVELLASVPTVVLGYFGLMLVAPGLVAMLGKALNFESGRCLVSTAIVMSVLVAPTLISVAEDALRSAPLSLRDGGTALGLSNSEMLRKVLLPAVKPGLIAALLLGFARAIGETMIVWILSGGTALMPNPTLQGLFQPVRGIPDTVGIEMANVEFEMPHYGHLFLIGLILFLITTSVNLTGYWFTRRRAWQL